MESVLVRASGNLAAAADEDEAIPDSGCVDLNAENDPVAYVVGSIRLDILDCSEVFGNRVNVNFRKAFGGVIGIVLSLTGFILSC